MKLEIRKVWPLVVIIVSVIGIVILRYGPDLFSRGQSGAGPGVVNSDLAVGDLGYLQHQARRVSGK